ncbi:hypothetical protein [Planctomicrobium sp. SH527]
MARGKRDAGTNEDLIRYVGKGESRRGFRGERHGRQVNGELGAVNSKA